MARGGGRLEAAARGRRPRGRGALGLLCLAVLCGLGAAEAEFSILEEAQVLATQMRKLATEELGVVTMQVRPGRLSPLPPACVVLPPPSLPIPGFALPFFLPSPPALLLFFFFFFFLVLPFFANFPSLCAGPALCAAIPRCPRGTKSTDPSSPQPPPPASRPEPRRAGGEGGGLCEMGAGEGTVGGKCGFKRLRAERAMSSGGLYPNGL